MKGRKASARIGSIIGPIVATIIAVAMLCWPLLLVVGAIIGIVVFIGAIFLFVFALAAGEYVILAIILLLVVAAALTLVSDRVLKALGRQGLLRYTSDGSFYLKSEGALRKR